MDSSTKFCVYMLFSCSLGCILVYCPILIILLLLFFTNVLVHSVTLSLSASAFLYLWYIFSAVLLQKIIGLARYLILMFTHCNSSYNDLHQNGMFRVYNLCLDRWSRNWVSAAGISAILRSFFRSYGYMEGTLKKKTHASVTYSCHIL